jgi:sigma-B regulation protein RsbU (phosphoserine phosphatase)
MPINPADLLAIVRADVISLAVGAILAVVALLTLAVLAIARVRLATLFLLGVFALFGGVRLLVCTTTFRLYLDGSPSWDFAATAIANAFPDAIPIRQELARMFASLVAIAFSVGMLAWLFRPGLVPSRELRALRIGALCVSLTAAADALRGMRLLVIPGPDLEPFGITVLVACVGTVAIWRLRGEAQRLAVIDRELSLAREIQSSILPQTMPRIPGLSAFARYRPMRAVAGDFYDFLGMDEERLGVLVADVSGHGVPAALIASMVKVALAAQSDRSDRPAAVLTGMNQSLCGHLAGKYVTAAYVFIDTRSGVIRYSAAGHPPMLRLTGRSRDACTVEENGLPLGVLKDAEYEEMELQLQESDRLLLYTDGLIEAGNSDGDYFGLDRLTAALARGAALPLETAADDIVRTIDAWSGQPQEDDSTIVLIDWRAPYQSLVDSPPERHSVSRRRMSDCQHGDRKGAHDDRKSSQMPGTAHGQVAHASAHP